MLIQNIGYSLDKLDNIFQICTPLNFIRYSERKLVWITGTRNSLKDLVMKIIEFAGFTFQVDKMIENQTPSSLVSNKYPPF